MGKKYYYMNERNFPQLQVLADLSSIVFKFNQK